ncbi:NYN domain-containing protein [Abortiporus biennis]|nr:NYN domain-containing protein [Abortiporus biennis]
MAEGSFTESVAIFWDYENCEIPSYSDGYTVANGILRIAHQYGAVKVFRSYSEAPNDRPHSRLSTLRSELTYSGVQLIDCPHNGSKDVADKIMIVDMMGFAMDTPAPATIILITGDRDFSYAAAFLRGRRYRIVLIAPTAVHASLRIQASKIYDWCEHVAPPSTLISTGPSPRKSHQLAIRHHEVTRSSRIIYPSSIQTSNSLQTSVSHIGSTPRRLQIEPGPCSSHGEQDSLHDEPSGLTTVPEESELVEPSSRSATKRPPNGHRAHSVPPPPSPASPVSTNSSSSTLQDESTDTESSSADEPDSSSSSSEDENESSTEPDPKKYPYIYKDRSKHGHCYRTISLKSIKSKPKSLIPLIGAMIIQRNEGKRIVASSQLGAILMNISEDVYTNAGVRKLKDYIKLAVDNKVVVTKDAKDVLGNGQFWVQFHPSFLSFYKG